MLFVELIDPELVETRPKQTQTNPFFRKYRRWGATCTSPPNVVLYIYIYLPLSLLCMVLPLVLRDRQKLVHAADTQTDRIMARRLKRTSRSGLSSNFHHAFFFVRAFIFTYSPSTCSLQAKRVNTSICATSKVFSPRPGSGNFKRSCYSSHFVAKTSLTNIA